MFIQISHCSDSVALLLIILYYLILKSDNISPPTLFLFYKVVLAILGHLHFHMNFRIVLSIFSKMLVGILIGIAKENCHLNKSEFSDS